MARDFARGEKLVVCLGDNIFENAQADAIRRWDDGALVFVREVDDPESFGVVAYDEDGDVDRHRREGRRRRHALRRAAVERRGRRALLLPARRVRDHRLARAVEPRRARDHRRQPRVRAARRAPGRAASRAGGTTAASTGATSPTSGGRSRRPASTSERRPRFPLDAARGRARLVRGARARERAAEARSSRRTSRARARA